MFYRRAMKPPFPLIAPVAASFTFAAIVAIFLWSLPPAPTPRADRCETPALALLGEDTARLRAAIAILERRAAAVAGRLAPDGPAGVAGGAGRPDRIGPPAN